MDVINAGTLFPRCRGFAAAGFLLSVLGLGGMTGCSWLAPLIFMGEHKERVPAEFNKLPGHSVAIATWAEQDTLFDYPHVRMELSLHIADRLASNIEGLGIADGRRIEDYLQRTLANTIDPIEIGERFKSDMVIYIELLEFQIRDPQSPDFLNPRIDASVTVFDISEDPENPKSYDLTPVRIERTGGLFNETSAQVARKALYEEFAETVARKFYEHKVEMLK